MAHGIENAKTRSIDRFMNLSVPVTESGCLLWVGCCYKNGLRYGKFRLNGKMILAHRASWMIFNGSIPNGKMVCHRCDVPECVNPKHLFIGDAKTNMHDKIAKGRHKGAHAGAEHHFAKLSPIDISKIRASNKNQYLLAKIFGVSQPQISNIKRGKRWQGA